MVLQVELQILVLQPLNLIYIILLSDNSKMKSEKVCLKKLNNLPDDLLKQIYNYIPGLAVVFLNKSLYIKYHTCLKPIIVKNNFLFIFVFILIVI